MCALGEQPNITSNYRQTLIMPFLVLSNVEASMNKIVLWICVPVNSSLVVGNNYYFTRYSLDSVGMALLHRQQTIWPYVKPMRMRGR